MLPARVRAREVTHSHGGKAEVEMHDWGERIGLDGAAQLIDRIMIAREPVQRALS